MRISEGKLGEMLADLAVLRVVLGHLLAAVTAESPAAAETLRRMIERETRKFDEAEASGFASLALFDPQRARELLVEFGASLPPAPVDPDDPEAASRKPRRPPHWA